MRRPARSFSDLMVWQKAQALVLAVYRLTAAFPKAETYGLTAQMRRAAVSIPANIAEGFGKRSRADSPPGFRLRPLPQVLAAARLLCGAGIQPAWASFIIPPRGRAAASFASASGWPESIPPRPRFASGQTLRDRRPAE